MKETIESLFYRTSGQETRYSLLAMVSKGNIRVKVAGCDQLVDILLIAGGGEVETTCYIPIPCTQSCLTLCKPIGCSLP